MTLQPGMSISHACLLCGINSPCLSLTFFAVSDRDLKPPHKGPKKPHHKSLLALDTDAQIDLLSTYTLSEVVPLIEDLEQSFDDDSDKEKHKEFLKKILRAILAYHILPTSFDIASLAANATQATNLTFPGAIGGEPQRIKVSHSLLPPKTTINLFSKVVRPNINTTNGTPLFTTPSRFKLLISLSRIHTRRQSPSFTPTRSFQRTLPRSFFLFFLRK